MVLLGTLVNVLAIIIGSMIGSRLNGIKEQTRTTVIQGIGLAVIVLGVTMGMKTEHILLVIASLVVGSIIGEWWKIDARLNQLGAWIEKKTGKYGKGNIASGFVTATLVYCIGAMSILGALDSGLRHNHQILFTKSMLDGFMSILFTSTMGIGVIFAAIPVFLYQGAIALSAVFIKSVVGDEILNQVINEVTATGGLMIMAIGINLLEIKQIRVANMLPALLIISILVPLVSYLVS